MTKGLKLSFWLCGPLMLFSINGPAMQFEDISTAAGVDDVHQSIGFSAGQAWIDVNRDGLLDLFVSDRLGPNHLYINQGDETFSELPQYDDLAMTSDVSNGVVIGDYDNDGWQDIYIACNGPNRLFRNVGGASFVEVGAAAGVDNPYYSEVAAWADVNNDGFIDLYLVNYSDQSGAPGAEQTRDVFYINQGNGTFADMGDELDLDELMKPGLAVTFLDFDEDGDLDLYVINDKEHGNTLWRNNGAPSAECTMTWCFSDVSAATNAGREVDGMGIAVGDYDLDGDEDLYFSGDSEQVLLQSQLAQGQAVYVERSDESGLNYIALGWATLFLDVDNDTWLDAYLATWGRSARFADQLYINQQDETFEPVGETSGIQTLTSSVGAAQGDFNNDGLMDVIVTDPGTQYFLFKNITGSEHNWASFELSGGGPINRDALGAKVEIQASDLKTYKRTLVSGGSRGSGNELRLHFGLGSATIESATVTWPNGQQHELQADLNAINSVKYLEFGMIAEDGFE
jgi:hypothetical protein